MRVVLPLLLIVPLAACTTTYNQVSTDAEPWDKAHGECDYRSAQASGPHQNGWVAMAVQARVYRSCMRARGWAPAN